MKAGFHVTVSFGDACHNHLIMNEMIGRKVYLPSWLLLILVGGGTKELSLGHRYFHAASYQQDKPFSNKIYWKAKKIPWITLALKNSHSALCWNKDTADWTVAWNWWLVSLFGRNGGVEIFLILKSELRGKFGGVQERNQGPEVGGRLLNGGGGDFIEEAWLACTSALSHLLYFVVVFK